MGCSVMTYDEPVLGDQGLETLKYRRDFNKLKLYCEMKHMNDEKLPYCRP